MGLDDREALTVLRGALGSDELVRRFYTRWFAVDAEVADLFPPDMDRQRTVFAKAMTWLLGELIAQRADEPVAFLAQLGRDHRKYAVSRNGTTTACRTPCSPPCAASCSTGGTLDSPAPPSQAVRLIVGIMRGAADAEKGPPFRDGTVVEHLRVTRDVSVIRLRLDEPLHFHPGQYVTVQVPQWPRRWRHLSPSIPADRGGGIEFHVRSVPGGTVSAAIVGETSGRRPVAAVQSARRHARRPQRWRRADGRGRHRVSRPCGRSSWTSAASA